jgi:chromosome segregation ATPase
MTLLEKLRSSAQTAEAEADAATQRAAASAEAAKQATQKAESLQRSVDSANEVLTTANEQRAFFAQRVQELLDSAAGIWGQSRLYLGASITSSPVYGTLGQCERAIEDYDERVRPLLVASVQAAQAELDTFAAEANTQLPKG